ncbi:MAG: YraN family protein [Pseudomonadota bacterium]
MSRRRKRAERYGRLAEWAAAALLTLKGYRIEAMRFKTSLGEIDLVARRGRLLVFVEVKARRRAEDALNALTPRLQRRVEAAADLFRARRPNLADLDMRYDAVTVTRAGMRHLKSVWRPAA